MRKRTLTQTLTGTWAADNAGIATDIDRTGLITQIDVTIEVTPSATLAGAFNQPDGLFRVIQNLRVVGGEHTYFTLPAEDPCGGGILLHYLNMVDGFSLGHPSGGITAPMRTYTPVTYILHCGSRVRDLWGNPNPFDLSAFIPARMESQLRAEWVTSGNDVMDDGVTITSAVARYTLHIVQGTEGEIKAEMARQGVQMMPDAPHGMVPAWVVERFDHTATSSDYSTERDVPTGGFLKRIAIIEQDATADRAIRAEDEVTGIAVKLVDQGEDLVKTFADRLQSLVRGPASFLEADDAALDFGHSVPVGILVVDLRPHVTTHPDYGLDLRNLRTGAVKLGFTITTYAAGDSSLILYERYMANRKGLATA